MDVEGDHLQFVDVLFAFAFSLFGCPGFDNGFGRDRSRGARVLSVEFGDCFLGVRQVDFVLPSIFAFGPAFPFDEEDDFVAEYFGFTNGFDFPLGFSFDDVGRRFRVVGSFGVLVIGFNLGYVENRVYVFPLLRKGETISVSSDPFCDLERSRTFLG